MDAGSHKDLVDLNGIQSMADLLEENLQPVCLCSSASGSMLPRKPTALHLCKSKASHSCVCGCLSQTLSWLEAFISNCSWSAVILY